MPRDAQNQTAIILPDLLVSTAATIAPLRALLETAKDSVRDKVMVDGRVSGELVEAEQTAAHGLAWVATYVEALAQ
ncbi:MAG: acyl-CoA dehydrogenase family protein, partial [Octadecabacter sp.]